MLSKTILLALSALLPAVCAEQKRSDFVGLGQLRTLYIGTGHEDLGCLTSAGQWTVDESQCGVFAAAPLDNGVFHLFAPKTGGCGVDVATFKCGGGVKGATFGVSTPTTYPRRDVVGTGWDG